MRVSRLALVLVSALPVFAGCAGRQEDQVLEPQVFGMLETTAPIYDDGQTQIFQVSAPVRLPIRGARDGERPSGDEAPYPRYPFLRASDVRVTVRFTLSNLEDKESIVELLVDPWNEFVRYVPGIAMGAEEEALPNLSGIQRFYKLPPLGRVQGILTPDDMTELASDLATAMAIAVRPPPADDPFGGPLLYNRAMNVQNRGTVRFDPVLAPFVPKVLAGITGFDVGLRSASPVRVAAEIVVDLEDQSDAGDVVIPPGDVERRIGRPDDTLSPPAGGPAM